MTGPSLRAGHCSQGGEFLVVNDELATLAATSLSGSTGLAGLFVTARASLATSGFEIITIVASSLETEKVCVLVGAGRNSVDLVVDLGGGHLVVLVVEILDVLGVHLLNLASLLLGKETRGLSLLGGDVVVEGEADLLEDRLRLGLLLLAGFTARLLFLLLLLSVVVRIIFAPVALSVATLLVAAAASAGAVLAVHWVSILTGLALMAVSTSAGTVGGLAFLVLKLAFGVSWLGSLGSITTTTAAFATFTTFATLATLAITTSLGSVATTTATTTATLAATLRALVANALEFSGISFVDFSLLNLHDGSLLGFLLFDLLLGLLDLSGNSILISKSTESVSFHLQEQVRIQILRFLLSYPVAPFYPEH